MTAVSETTDDPIKSLLKQLIKQVHQQEKPPNHSNGEVDVLVDCEINSVRYTLISKPSITTNPTIHLSPREEEIARLIAKGRSNKEVAAILDISPWTVATHLRRIFNKLGVGSRAEMVACILKQNLLSQPDKVPHYHE
jgi:DNA-binding CsgD family transcriptional regulator